MSAVATVHRLAVLLEAGIAPGRAWEVLADGGDPVAATVCAARAAGRPRQAKPSSDADLSQPSAAATGCLPPA